MLKAIIFDLYETLVTQFDPDWIPPKMSMAARLGIKEEDFQLHLGRLRDDWQTGQLSSYHDFLLALCKAAGHTPSESVIDELAQERSRGTLMPFERIESTIVELVQELRSRGFRLGVITNAGDTDVEPWPTCRLAPFFEVFISSHEVGMLKPDREIFEHGMRELGVSAEEAIFVGDGGSDELSGAARAGLTALWATWFLDRWSYGRRPVRFKRDEWRQFPGGEPPFPRLHSPLELLDRIRSIRLSGSLIPVAWLCWNVM